MENLITIPVECYLIITTLCLIAVYFDNKADLKK